MNHVAACDVFGATVTVNASAPLDGLLRDALVDLHAPERDPGATTYSLTSEFADGTWTNRCDGDERYVGPDASTALYDTLISLNHLASTRAAEHGRAVLHGGAVAIGDGAVAMVGHSGAGKSTLTLALSRAGHGFLCDEVVAIDDDLTVERFPRPIGLRSGGADLLGIEVPEGPFESILPFRATPVGEAGRPLRVVYVLRRSDDGTVGTERLSDGRALFELTNQTLGSSTVERAMFLRLEELVRRVPVVVLRYRDLHEAIDVIERTA